MKNNIILNYQNRLSEIIYRRDFVYAFNELKICSIFICAYDKITEECLRYNMDVSPEDVFVKNINNKYIYNMKKICTFKCSEEKVDEVFIKADSLIKINNHDSNNPLLKADLNSDRTGIDIYKYEKK